MTSIRRARKRDRTRQALLDASLSLFSQRGIYTPSIEEITECADLGKGTFYQYFSSREALIAELVRRGIDGLLDALDGEVSGAGERQDALGAVFLAHGRYYRDHPEYLLILHQARGMMKLLKGGGSPIRKEFMRYIERLERYVPKRVGGLPVGAPRRRRMALVLGGFASGVSSFQYLFGGGPEALPGLPEDAVLLAALATT